MRISELSTLRLEPGSRLAQMDWGPLVTGESARRIACDAAITQVIVDSNGEPQALLYLPPHPAHPENARYRTGAGIQRSAP